MAKYNKKRVKLIVSLIESDDYTITEVCAQAGITKETFYQWKKTVPYFSDQIAAAEERRIETFRKAARSGLLTLLNGKEYEETVTEYVEGKPGPDGKPVPKIKVQKKTKKFILPNATSVIFALKNLDEETFKDISKQEHTGKGGTPLIPAITHNINFKKCDK